MQAVSFNSDLGVPTNDPRPGVGAVIRGGRTSMFLWSPTARDLTDSTGVANGVSYESSRTASTIYLRLLSEKIRMSTSDSTPWIWRRIVITTKSPLWRTLIPTEATSGKNKFPYIETTNGFSRLLQQWDDLAGSPETQKTILDDLFRGKQGKDWSDPITAPVDTLTLNKLYDKTVTIRSGNDTGTVRMTRRTHTFNKTFRYFEDENGQFQDSAHWSSLGKGMGDVFIVDFFSNFIGGASTLLKFEPEATLYWHEK